MLLNYFLLASSVSIDSLGIGITYGLRKMKITKPAKLILFLFSFIITMFSVFLGNLLTKYLPEFLTRWIGTLLLIGMGIWIISQSLFPSRQKENSSQIVSFPKIHQFILEPLGITIQIIRNPVTSDLDDSHQIDAKEAFYLGLALSLDSICVGIGSSLIGFNTLLFPILVATFQLIFLSLGTRIGKKILTTSSLPESIWNVISGGLLLLIGIGKLFL